MAELPTRTLGRTNLEVTRLGYGAMELRGSRGGPDVSEREAERILNAVLAAGSIPWGDLALLTAIALGSLGLGWAFWRRRDFYAA